MVAAVLVAVAAGWPIYVDPQVDDPTPADAVVVLGGPGSERYQVGLDLMRRGLAPQLVISNPVGDPEEMPNPLCDQQFEFVVSCFVPDPSNTRGEAIEIRDRAEAQHWTSIIVVTWKPHVSRARYVIEKCYSGELTMVASSHDMRRAYWPWAYIYQTAGYVRSFLHRGC
ncbi:YdcF family protein [Rhodococcus sp. NPDC059234]|uniref:YdcF family protein n=1 Tax=Rhodococcus sp. NPDC059234 TaxID=3346781 RepID=UPI003671943B